MQIKDHASHKRLSGWEGGLPPLRLNGIRPERGQATLPNLRDYVARMKILDSGVIIRMGCVERVVIQSEVKGALLESEAGYFHADVRSVIGIGHSFQHYLHRHGPIVFELSLSCWNDYYVRCFTGWP